MSPRCHPSLICPPPGSGSSRFPRTSRGRGRGGEGRNGTVQGGGRAAGETRRPRGTSLPSLPAYDSWCGVAHGCTRKIGLKICGKSASALAVRHPTLRDAEPGSVPPRLPRRVAPRAGPPAPPLAWGAPSRPHGGSAPPPRPRRPALSGICLGPGVVRCGRDGCGPRRPPAINGGVQGPAAPGGGSARAASGQERAGGLAASHCLKFFNLI